MFRKKIKPTESRALPPDVDAEIHGLISKLKTKSGIKKTNAFLRALKVVYTKISINPRYRPRSVEKWVVNVCIGQLSLSALGLMGGIIDARTLPACLAAVPFIVAFVLFVKENHRLAILLATLSSLVGLPMIFLSLFHLSWLAFVIQLTPPIGHLLFLTLKEMRAKSQEETRTNEQRTNELQKAPIQGLRQLIAEHRQQIIGKESEFGSLLAKLEGKLSQIRLNRIYWEKRSRTNPDSTLFAARLAAARRLEDRLTEDIGSLQGKKQQIVAGLDQLEARLPTIDSELEDWRRDRELQTLTAEEEQLSRETEEIARRTIFAFAAEMQHIAAGIEGLRLNIAGYTCDPHAIEATDQKAGEIISDTGASIAASNIVAGD